MRIDSNKEDTMSVAVFVTADSLAACYRVFNGERTCRRLPSVESIKKIFINPLKPELNPI